MAGVSFAVLSYPSDTVFEEIANPVRTEVSIVPAAAPRPVTQEEILAAVLAARDERDIPAEDDSWVITDSDGGRPAGLDGAELDELLAAAPSGPSGQGRPPGSAWPTGPGEQVAAPAAPSGSAGPTWLGELDGLPAPAPAGRPRLAPLTSCPGAGRVAGSGSPRAVCWTGWRRGWRWPGAPTTRTPDWAG
jgi:hypothetical protein